MYTWTLDLYIWTIKIIFVIFPFLIIFINKQKKININKFKVILISFVLFIILTVLLLLTREYHINTIRDICFNSLGYNYKVTPIPEGCHLFNRDKYMGVGWPLTAIFLIAYNFIYHIILYFIWNIFDFFKNKKNVT